MLQPYEGAPKPLDTPMSKKPTPAAKVKPATKAKPAAKPATKKRATSNGAKTNAAAVAIRVKDAKALELRMEGLTFEDIAEQLGFAGRQGAYESVKRSLVAVIREPATELIRLDLERLDKMWQISFLKASAGDIDCINVCLKIMERRAKLEGLDAAVKVAATVDDPKGVLVAGPVLTPEEWMKAAAKQQAELQRGAQDAP